jgi:hypothetical protein
MKRLAYQTNLNLDGQHCIRCGRRLRGQRSIEMRAGRECQKKIKDDLYRAWIKKHS